MYVAEYPVRLQFFYDKLCIRILDSIHICGDQSIATSQQIFYYNFHILALCYIRASDDNLITSYTWKFVGRLGIEDVRSWKAYKIEFCIILQIRDTFKFNI